ncbi:MAG TPA: beta-galactosidase [Treponemataceae bacterium]|nr:beta-galactosidase [Treponemataceae bacterium]
MTTYGFTPEYLTKNNEPWFPVMGEIHYSRFPKEYWRESILKMKAGGVTVISSYVIWIHHEEEEGVWDFSGSRDLRSFINMCGECGVSLFLRIGPWCHGEVRNGGFPDWLLKKDFTVRTNDPEYFKTVKTFYDKIYEQAQGLLLKDTSLFPSGGPVIGVQIENEFGHCGGLSGPEGEEHMTTLTGMAKNAGFDVPLYTATGWGGAVTGGLIPVMGGYCEAPWDQRLTEIEPSGNYIFTHERNDHNIGSDFGFGTGITFDIQKFPFLTAELGGGLQVTRHRRPLASASDIGAMSLVKLGSGVNLLGYYMYHGGTNPLGKLSALQESRETGSINDLPQLSYDFKAPVREYGQLSQTYKELSLMTKFTADFGRELCNMKAVIPQDNPLYPTNSEDLRYSFRENEKGEGYVFVNNYQRHRKLKDHKNVNITTPESASRISVRFPSIDVPDAAYFFLPYNMKIGNGTLEYSLATPLCILQKEKSVYVFYTAHSKAQTLLAQGRVNDLYKFSVKPSDAEIITLTRNEALNAVKIDNRLFISTAEIYSDAGFVYCGFRRSSYECMTHLIERTEDKSIYQLDIPQWEGDDCFMTISYHGNTACLYEDGKLIADNFFITPDEPWEIGLKRFGKGQSHSFRLEIFALNETDKIYLEKKPPFIKGKACSLGSVYCTPQEMKVYSKDELGKGIEDVKII